MQDGELWWYRYGRYTPGPYNSPHMGEVLADYRRRRYWTQQAFAEAIGVSWRTVREWEMSDVISDTGRRIFLAKVLRIPPVLLGLTWYQVYGEQEPQGYEEGLLSAAERMEADSYYHYEDTLALGGSCSMREIVGGGGSDGEAAEEVGGDSGEGAGGTGAGGVA